MLLRRARDRGAGRAGVGTPTGRGIARGTGIVLCGSAGTTSGDPDPEKNYRAHAVGYHAHPTDRSLHFMRDSYHGVSGRARAAS